MNLTDVQVWVIDSSALIEAKSIISIRNQWSAFKHLEQMVLEGRIAMPRQMIKEVSEVTHPDMPGAWAAGVRNSLRHPLNVGDDYITHVMRVAPDVVDPKKDREDADPWVLALALELAAKQLITCIVTEDIVDRHRISIATACSRLGLDWCSTRDFLGHCEISMLGKGKG